MGITQGINLIKDLTSYTNNEGIIGDKKSPTIIPFGVNGFSTSLTFPLPAPKNVLLFKFDSKNYNRITINTLISNSNIIDLVPSSPGSFFLSFHTQFTIQTHLSAESFTPITSNPTNWIDHSAFAYIPTQVPANEGELQNLSPGVTVGLHANTSNTTIEVIYSGVSEGSAIRGIATLM